MNRSHAMVLVLMGAGLAAPVYAQDVRTPTEIAAALRGSQAAPAEATAPADDGSMVLGDEERAFSLARPQASAAKPRDSYVRPSAAAQPNFGRRSVTRAAQPALVRSAARAAISPGAPSLDMKLTFATGSAELDAEARRRIDPFATALSQAGYGLSGSTFRVEGHTDSVGSRADNMELSKRRAQAVVDYLVAKGVSPARLSSAGFGPDAPIKGRSARDGANRRVEIVKN